MKKLLIAFSLMIGTGVVAVAQDAKPVSATTLKVENMEFKSEVHDFGTIPEGPSAEHVFTFKNTGKEPIILQKVQPSCGCTTPTYTNEPIAPGKTGSIKVAYSTQGRPGPINKTVTVNSNAGTKILTIKGNVEKAPTTSVPQNNSSIMRTN